MVISIYLLCLGNIEMHFLCLYSFLVLSLGPLQNNDFSKMKLQIMNTYTVLNLKTINLTR